MKLKLKLSQHAASGGVQLLETEMKCLNLFYVIKYLFF